MLVQKVDIKQWEGYLPLLKKKMTQFNAVCELCHFQSPKFMSLSAVEFVTSISSINEQHVKLTCPICSDALNLSASRSKGYVVALPELSQSALNAIIYAHWAIKCSISILDKSVISEQTESKISTLEKNLSNLVKEIVQARVKPVNALFAYDVTPTYSASEPGELGSCILTLEDEEITSVLQGPVLSQMRYLPNEDAYQNQIKYWSNKLFSKLTLEQLHKISIYYHDFLEKNGVLKTLV